MVQAVEPHSFSVPSVSLTSQLTIENDDDEELEEYSRERSRSFIESMRENVPSPARIPSPKPHRKSHGSHKSSNDVRRTSGEGRHRHHHSKGSNSPIHRSQTSPILPTKSYDLNMSHHFLDPVFFAGRERSHSYSGDTERKSPISSRKQFNAGQDLHRSKSNTTISDHMSKFFIGDDDDNIFSRSNPDLTLKNRISVKDCNKSKVDDEKTISRRSLEMKEMKEKIERDSCKRKTLDRIDQLLAHCDGNFNTVESNINFTFVRLANTLHARRQELIDEAKKICEQKKECLSRSREKCLLCRECKDVCTNSPLVNLISNDEENNSRRNSASSGSIDGLDEVLQTNGILEPWKCDSDVDIVNMNGEDKPHTVNSQTYLSDIFEEVLEEGNMTFNFTGDEITEMFSTIGTIKEDLSSSQFSFVKGLHKGIAITGETVQFEIHTRSLSGQATYNKKDKLNVEVFDCYGEKVEVVLNIPSNKRGFSCNNSMNGLFSSPAASPNSSQTSIGSRFYAPYFTPKESGQYKIVVKVNEVELPTSPMIYTVYPKMNLTFDMKSPSCEKPTEINNVINLNSDSSHMERRRLMLRRESSEDSDWQKSQWIPQKGEKSTLLRSNDELPSVIYAATVVNGLCAWKLRVTSACASITLSIGVGTRTGIPDLDDQFCCNFCVGKETEGQQEKKNAQKISLRRMSSFTRVSLTYCVLLNTEEGTVRVISENSNEDKTVAITPDVLKNGQLYPFLSMIHHHESCLMQVCPRPQITLL